MKKQHGIELTPEVIAKSSAEIRDFLYRFFIRGEIPNNEDGFEQFKTFCESILKGSNYANSTVNVPVYVNVLNDNENGRFTSIDGLVGNTSYILISSDMVRSIISNEAPLAKLVLTLSHEDRHAMQSLANKNLDPKTLSEEDKAKFYEFDKAFHEKQLSPEEVYDIHSLLSFMMTSEYLEKFKALDKQKQIALCKNISLSNYAMLKHEEDARDFSIRFSRQFFERLLHDPNLDKSLVPYINAQLEYVESYSKQNDSENEQASQIYSEFQQIFVDAQVEDVSDFNVLYKSLFPEVSLHKNAKMKNSYNNLNSALNIFVQQKCKTLPTDEKLHWLYYSLCSGSTAISDNLISELLNDNNTSKELQSEIRAAIADILKGDIHPDSYGINISGIYLDSEQNLKTSPSISLDERLDIFDSLADKKRIRTMDRFMHNIIDYNGVDLKTRTYVLKRLTPLIIDYIAKLDRQDENIITDDYSSFLIILTEDLIISEASMPEGQEKKYREFNKKIDFLIEQLKKRKNLRNALIKSIPQEKERALYKQTYGEIATRVRFDEHTWHSSSASNSNSDNSTKLLPSDS